MEAQGDTIAIRDALATYGLDVTIHNRAVSGYDLSQILTVAQNAVVEFAGAESSTLFQFHGGGNNLEGVGWPHNAAEIEQGLRDVINTVTSAGFAIAPSALSWRNVAAPGTVDTVPYNDNIYIPVINELTPLWGGARPVVDLWTLYSNNQDWIKADGTHPTADGDYETALYIGNQLATNLAPTLELSARNVADLKGAAYGTLASEAQLFTDFEIEVNYQLNATATGLQNLLGSLDNASFLLINHDDKELYIKLAGTLKVLSAPVLPDLDASPHRIVFYRRGSTVYVVWDNLYLGSVAVNNNAVGFDMVGRRTSSSAVDGRLWDVDMWSAGNRYTGTPVLSLAIDSVGQAVQPDAVSGNDMTFTGLDQGNDWTTVTTWVDPSIAG